MYIFILVVYLLVALSLVLLIMLQHGKGMDIGTDTFNIRGLLGGIRGGDSVSIMTHLITILGILFFCFSLLLGNINNKHSKQDSINNVNNSLLLNDDMNVKIVNGVTDDSCIN